VKAMLNAGPSHLNVEVQVLNQTKRIEVYTRLLFFCCTATLDGGFYVVIGDHVFLT
jgi:hypothetical protein